MQTVEFEIPEIVRHIGRRRQDPERDESQQARGPCLDTIAFAGEDERHEDEQVLRPLMESQRLDQGQQDASPSQEILFQPVNATLPYWKNSRFRHDTGVDAPRLPRVSSENQPRPEAVSVLARR